MRVLFVPDELCDPSSYLAGVIAQVDQYFSIRWNQNLIDGEVRYSVNNQSFYRVETPLLVSEYYGLTPQYTELPHHFPPVSSNTTGLQPAKYATNVLSIKLGEFVQIVLQVRSTRRARRCSH